MPINFAEFLAEYFSTIKRKRARYRCEKRGESWFKYCNNNSIIDEELTKDDLFLKRSPKTEGGKTSFIPIPMIFRKRKRAYIRMKKDD